MEPEQQRSAEGVFAAKTEVYARFGNGVVEDLARQALAGGGRVLDVGCASGGLLARLDMASFRAGIEPAERAAAEARAVADAVHHGGIEDDLPWGRESFDVVVLAYVPEHLPTPDAALSRAFSLTRPGGTIIVSVPNVAHSKARRTLVLGRFPRADSGTFDATHLQCFTRERLVDMLLEAGVEQVEVHPVVPALRNHVPLVGAYARVERAWQALGRRRPTLFGYQLVAFGHRPGT